MALPRKSFSFTPGFSPVEEPSRFKETVLTVSFEMRGKTVETVSANVRSLAPG
jgi:hypothetical protein